MICPRRINFRSVGCIAFLVLWVSSFSLHAVLPGELIINEIYFDHYTKDRGEPGHFEAVELLVVKNQLNLNGIVVSDRDNWDIPAEHECHLQDAGMGFLNSVRAGTLVVIYDGIGDDDTNGDDFTLTFYARSSIFCNAAGKTNAFNLGNYGDNVHLLHGNNQVDFIKFRPNDRPERGGHPGKLSWDKGNEGFIDVGRYGQNTGIRFLGEDPDQNNFPSEWQPYPESLMRRNNLGKPNGGRNEAWIRKLRGQEEGDGSTKPRKKGRPKNGATTN